MAMLALNHAILSMSTRIGELSESPLLSKKTTQYLGDILPVELAQNTRISMENWV
jgi:hypothetical protein